MLAMLYPIHLYGHHVETLDTFDVIVQKEKHVKRAFCPTTGVIGPPFMG